jgi:hypothetical protein
MACEGVTQLQAEERTELEFARSSAMNKPAWRTLGSAWRRQSRSQPNFRPRRFWCNRPRRPSAAAQLDISASVLCDGDGGLLWLRR